MRAYIDSDILIWYLRGETKAARLLRTLSLELGTELWIGALQRPEVTARSPIAAGTLRTASTSTTQCWRRPWRQPAARS
jgi:hypothetical protein